MYFAKLENSHVCPWKSGKNPVCDRANFCRDPSVFQDLADYIHGTRVSREKMTTMYKYIQWRFIYTDIIQYTSSSTAFVRVRTPKTSLAVSCHTHRVLPGSLPRS